MELGQGRGVVLFDESDGRSYFVVAAARASGDLLAGMIAYGRGALRVALPAARLVDLRIPAVAAAHGDRHYLPVDLRGHDRTGALDDRAATIVALARPATEATDLTWPGHVMTIAAHDGGVLAMADPPSAGVDLARSACGRAAAVLVEAADARYSRLANWARAAVRIGDVLAHQQYHEPAVRRVADASLPSAAGAFMAHGYGAVRSPAEYVALVKGDPGTSDLRVHVHDQCHVGDVFASASCHCGAMLRTAQREIAAMNSGLIVYRSRDGAEAARHLYRPTIAVAHPSAGHANEIAHILRDIGVVSARLSANEPIDVNLIARLSAARVVPARPRARRRL